MGARELAQSKSSPATVTLVSSHLVSFLGYRAGALLVSVTSAALSTRDRQGSDNNVSNSSKQTTQRNIAARLTILPLNKILLKGSRAQALQHR